MPLSPTAYSDRTELFIVYPTACPEPVEGFEMFTAEEFIAAITQHIPDKSFQMVRYGACPELVEGDGIPIGTEVKGTSLS
jgi:hypothetical protein